MGAVAMIVLHPSGVIQYFARAKHRSVMALGRGASYSCYDSVRGNQGMSRVAKNFLEVRQIPKWCRQFKDFAPGADSINVKVL